MLCLNTYGQGYVDDCRRLVEAQIATYEALISSTRKAEAGRSRVDAAVAGFEPRFFNSMLLVLDALFVHRSRTIEKKDGNALNEVRVLCTSIMENDAVMVADKAIKLDPARSVLKYEVGDAINLTPSDFVLISQAFFAELQERFV